MYLRPSGNSCKSQQKNKSSTCRVRRYIMDLGKTLILECDRFKYFRCLSLQIDLGNVLNSVSYKHNTFRYTWLKIWLTLPLFITLYIITDLNDVTRFITLYIITDLNRNWLLTFYSDETNEALIVDTNFAFEKKFGSLTKLLQKSNQKLKIAAFMLKDV
ncbi:hypothetical protein HanIR_Chr05g0250781 [Helianthus annuus]|nr:hypothetical protein HanIR_Chr05g0250781 [Helianthus annuus]